MSQQQQQQINDPNREPTLVQIGQLLTAVHAGGDKQRQADAHLDQAKDQYFGLTIIRLLEILVSTDERVTNDIRQMAGIVAARFIGGQIGHNSIEMKEKLIKRWNNESVDVKNFIKNASMSVMDHPSHMVRSTGANIVAKIATIETLKSWDIMPNLINKLKQDIRWHDTVFTIIRELLFDDNTHENIEKYLIPILQAMEMAIKSNNSEARKSAVECLEQLVPLLDPIFANSSTQSTLMQLILSCCESNTDSTLQCTALQTLISVIECHYEYIKIYFKPIFTMTGAIISKGLEDEITHGEAAKIAIEFWTVCAEVESTYIDAGQLSKCHNFVQDATASFLNLFLRCLYSQDVDAYDSDEWTMRKAAACSFEEISKIMGNKIIENNAIGQFIRRYYNTNEWHIKEALINLIGTITIGPKEPTIYNFILTPINEQNKNTTLLLLIAMSLKDNNQHVKQSAIWAFGKLCESCPRAVTNLGVEAIVTELGTLLVSGNSIQTRHACWSMSSLVEYWYHGNSGNTVNNTSNKPNNGQNQVQISKELTQKLIGAVFQRISQEPSEHTIAALFENINSIVEILTDSEAQLSLMVLKEIYVRIMNAWKEITAKSNDSKRQGYILAGALGSFAICLEHVTRQWRQDEYNKLKQQNNNNNNNNNNMDDIDVSNLPFPEIDENVVKNIMQISCGIGSVSNIAAFEEALNAVSALAFAVSDKIYPFLMEPKVQDLFINSLQMGKDQSNAVCKNASSSITEIYTACSKTLQASINPNNQQDPMIVFGDKIIKQLLNIISDKDVVLEVKPHIVDSVCNIAESFGRIASRYWNYILNEVGSLACQDTSGIDYNDIEMIEDINKVRIAAIQCIGMANLGAMENDETNYKFVCDHESGIFTLFTHIKNFGKYNNEEVLYQSYDLINTLIDDEPQCAAKFAQGVIQHLLELSLKNEVECNDENKNTKQLAQHIYAQLRNLGRQRN